VAQIARRRFEARQKHSESDQATVVKLTRRSGVDLHEAAIAIQNLLKKTSGRAQERACYVAMPAKRDGGLDDAAASHIVRPR
jgi:hypothetical protein